MTSLFPPQIRTVGVCAPAGRCDAAALNRSLDWLRAQGVQVVPGRHVGTPGDVPEYLSAPARARLDDLKELFADETIDLILCTRGGFGSAHLLEYPDFAELRRPGLPVAGFSDITALHMGFFKSGGALPVAGPMAAKFADSMTSEFNRRFFAAAWRENAYFLEPSPGLEFTFIGAAFAGLPVAANLTVLASLAGTPDMPDLHDRVLLLEDVNEPVYRLDRLLTQLRRSGAFSGVRGIVFGEFTGAGAGLERLLRETLERLSLPGVLHFPFGHGTELATVRFDRELHIGENHIEVACIRA